MSVGGVKGGGGKGRLGRGGPAGGAGGAGKAKGSSFGKVDRTERLVGGSGDVEGANVGAAAALGGAQGIDAVLSAHAQSIARQLKNGDLKDKGEATKKLVAEVLREKLRMQSKALTDKIADAIQDDPRLNQTLERLWSKG